MKSIKEWQKENPYKSINDYYTVYPPQRSEKLADRNQNGSIIEENPQIISYSNQRSKSIVVSVLLTLFFGPFGLLYSSFSRGLSMILLPVLGLFTGLVLPLICDKSQNETICLLSFAYWAGFFIFLLFYEAICIILAITTVQSFNRRNKVGKGAIT